MTARSVRAEVGARADWRAQEELLAAVFDRLGILVDLTHRAHFKGPHPTIVPLPRPGADGDGADDGGRPDQVVMAAPPAMSSKAEIRAFFGGPGGSIVVSDS